MRNAPSSGKGLRGPRDVLAAWWGSELFSACSLLGRGSTNLSRSHRATLLSPEQDKVVLAPKAAWALAPQCSRCCPKTHVEKEKRVSRSKGNRILCISLSFSARDSHAKT